MVNFISKMLKYMAQAGNPDDNIDNMLEYIGMEFKADRTYIFEQNERGNFDNTYEWCRQNVIPQIEILQDLKYKGLIDVWYKEFSKNKYIYISDIEDYKNISESMYNLLKMQGITSLISWPVFLNDVCIGFLGIDNPHLGYTDDIIQIFDMANNIVSTMLRHRDIIKLLEKTSLMDTLTGLNNRNALAIFVSDIYPNAKNIAMLYCDLNGLKVMNDNYGHEAGDRYIKNAADSLLAVFDPKTVYRIGGDEFVAIETDPSVDEFDERVIRVNEEFKKREVSMAVGTTFMENSDINFDEFLKEADKNMYLDKMKYYSDHKNNRRKNRS